MTSQPEPFASIVKAGAAIVAFAKVPRPGRVKTRLTSLLSEEEAAEVYEAFLRDALTVYAGMPATLRLYLAPGEDELPGDVCPPGASVHRQQGDGLGERLFAALIETFRAGHDRALLIGTDHPTLPPAFVELALEQLAEPKHVTIGPAEDGGYYLLGANDLFPDLFLGMAFSHDRVFEETLRRATTVASVSVLPTWYDVDTPDDLARLARDLEEADSGIAVHAREVIGRLRGKYPALA